MTRFCLVAATVYLGLALAEPATGGQVDWASSAFSTHQMSDGTPFDDSFVFELGAFANGFVPTLSNTAEWADQWRVAQRAHYNPGTQLVASSYVLEHNDSPFSTDDQAYFWGYSADHPGEWVLLTSPVWKWPAAGGAHPPVSWTVKNGVTRIAGTVHESGEPFFLQTAAIDPAHRAPWMSPDDWRSTHFSPAQIAGGQADWEADPDGDGRSNLTEMGLGTDPLSEASAASTTVTITAGHKLELAIDKAPDRAVDYWVEVSGDLVTWSRDESAVETVTDTLSRLVVRDRTPLTALYRRFIRLTVVLEE